MSSRSSIVTSLVIIIIVCGSVGGLLLMTNPYEPSRVAIIVMDPGFGDLSMADNIQLGMTEAGRDVAVQYYIPEVLPTSVSEAQTIMNDLSASGLYDLIIAIGADLASAVQTVADLYPAQKMGMIGASINADNVASATFASEQAAFLSGVLAAFQAAEDGYTNRVGIIAAMENDATLDPMINGFIQGVEAADAEYDLNVTVLDIVYLDSWNDSDGASDAAFNMFLDGDLIQPGNQPGASIIFAPVRASIVGVRNGSLRADEHRLFTFNPDRAPLIIAAEGNQDYYGCVDIDIPTAPSFIATSVLARTDLALYDMVNMTMWDQFTGFSQMYDLANGGVNITAYEYSSTYLSEATVEAVRSYHDEIIAGTIIVTP